MVIKLDGLSPPVCAKLAWSKHPDSGCESLELTKPHPNKPRIAIAATLVR